MCRDRLAWLNVGGDPECTKICKCLVCELVAGEFFDMALNVRFDFVPMQSRTLVLVHNGLGDRALEINAT